jgi:hypothetical protein
MLATRFTSALALAFSFASLSSAAPAPAVKERGLLDGLLGGATNGPSAALPIGPAELANVLAGLQSATVRFPWQSRLAASISRPFSFSSISQRIFRFCRDLSSPRSKLLPRTEP